jgi:flagellar FliL protein
MPTPPKSDPAPVKAASKSEPAAEAAAEAPPVPARPPRGGVMAWIPALAALVLAPAATWGTVEYVLLPRLQKKLAAATSPDATAPANPAAPSPGAPAAAHGKPSKDAAHPGHGKESAAGYEFQNVVVNLAGTMGTRYLKTSFLITGADANIKAIFDGAKPKLTDVTLNVLSSLTLADLEEPGAKNVIREKLVSAYNQALGRKVADQVYFSDFVIQ